MPRRPFLSSIAEQNAVREVVVKGDIVRLILAFDRISEAQWRQAAQGSVDDASSPVYDLIAERFVDSGHVAMRTALLRPAESLAQDLRSYFAHESTVHRINVFGRLREYRQRTRDWDALRTAFLDAYESERRGLHRHSAGIL